MKLNEPIVMETSPSNPIADIVDAIQAMWRVYRNVDILLIALGEDYGPAGPAEQLDCRGGFECEFECKCTDRGPAVPTKKSGT